MALTRDDIVAAIAELRWMPDEGRQQHGFHQQLADILTKLFGLDAKPCLSHRTIAEKYGISERCVKKLVIRALQQLGGIFLDQGHITHGAVSTKRLRNILRRPTP